jgi:hypothetical protein
MSILRHFNKHHGYTFEGKRTPLGGGKGAPAAPDYAAAAQQTAAGNLDAARVATAANRVNQYTPYGSLEYNVNPQSQWDIYGNPTWSATQSLAPAQQQLLDLQNQTSIGMGNLAGQGLGYVQNMISKPFDTSSLPSTGFNPGQTYQDAYMQRLAPQIQQTREAFDVKMANQGIPVDSEAYKRAALTQGQKENDLLLGATTQGFGTGLAANQQGFQQLGYMRNEPINTLNAVRTGAQVSSPNFVSNVPQQATTAGADMLGAAQMGYNAQLGASNASNAASSGLTSGLMGLGGTLGAAALMAPVASDIRMKENIEPVGILANGLTLYSYEYKDEFKDHPLAGHGKHRGVMAQEVEKVIPNAVFTLDNGYKAVDYGLL